MRRFSRRIHKKHVSVNGVSVDKVEHNFNVVMSHLRQVGMYRQTLAKHNALVIYRCVRRCLENSPSDALDLAVEFEQLREFDNIGDFLEHLERQHAVSKTYSEALLEDLALEDLKEKASILGLKILEKNEVAVGKNEYYYLKRLEQQMKKLKQNSKKWTLSLL